MLYVYAASVYGIYVPWMLGLLSAPQSPVVKKAGKLTVPLSLLVALLLVLGVDVLGLCDPVQVALQVLLQLLLLAELLEIAASLGLLALFREFSAREQGAETCVAFFLQVGSTDGVDKFKDLTHSTHPAPG